MASVVYITEFADIWRDVNGVPIPCEPSNGDQTVAAGASTAQSAALKNNTRLVRIKNDGGGAACIALGTNPTAVAGTSRHLTANGEHIVAVPMGQAWKVAVIANAT